MYEAMVCTHSYVHTLYSMQGKAGHQTIAQFGGPIMLASSVLAVVACNAAVPSVCTLVLYIVVLSVFLFVCACLCLSARANLWTDLSEYAWSEHVQFICSKFGKLLGLLYRQLYNNTSCDFLLQLYC